MAKDLTVDYEVFCDDCSAPMGRMTEMLETQAPNQRVTMRVPPCGNCVKKAIDEAEEGLEGRLAALEAGQTKMPPLSPNDGSDD